MRNCFCTAVLVAAIATVSAAQASPITKDAPATSEAVARTDVAATRTESFESSAQRVQSANTTDRTERQVLSRNFASKPVQIYWFFGGR